MGTLENREMHEVENQVLAWEGHNNVAWGGCAGYWDFNLPLLKIGSPTAIHRSQK
jgi:hypothetical protein